MAPIEYIGRYMGGWFDFGHLRMSCTSWPETRHRVTSRLLGRAAKRLIALTGTLMGGYADDLFNIFYRMEPHTMAGEGFAYGGQGRRDFQQQYGVLETIEKVRATDNACLAGQRRRRSKF